MLAKKNFQRFSEVEYVELEMSDLFWTKYLIERNYMNYCGFKKTAFVQDGTGMMQQT